MSGEFEVTDVSDLDAPDVSQAHNTKVYATVIRANGDVEEVGLISASYTNRWQSLMWKLFGKRKADRTIRRINRRHAERGEG